MVSELAPGPTTSSFLWPWAWAAVVVVVLAIGGTAWWLARRRQAARSDDAVWVANSAYVESVPAFAGLMRRYRLLQGSLAAALVVAVVGVGAVAARPVERKVVSDQLGTRDIVLCLDVSGSMVSYDGKVFEIFGELVKSFHGERIALSVFNSTSRTVFPLTDDYALVEEQFREGIEALDKDPSLLDFESGTEDKDILEFLQFVAGTMANISGASLVGDGLANCALQFDEEDTERSRSIILATDNFVSGEPIYTLEQAADLVDSRDIALHGIWANTDPGGFAGYGVGGEEEFRASVEKRGGLFFTADDPSVVESIVDDVVAQQARDLGARTEIVVTDLPGLWFLVVVLGVAALLVIAWRVRE